MTVMDLEKWLLSLPKPILAILMICVAIVVFAIINPPHTICQTETESMSKELEGWLLPQKVGKRTVPAKIQMALANCRHGNSSGSCYEYFNVLRKTALSIKNHSTDCASDFLSISIPSYAKMEVYEAYDDNGKEREELSSIRYDKAPLRQVLTEGMQMMVAQAWGEEPPEAGSGHYGWFQDYEFSVFCNLQDVIRANAGPDGWKGIQRETIAKLPGEKAVIKPVLPSVDGPPVTTAPVMAPALKMATAVLTEPQILERSLFGVTCSAYR